MVIPMERMFVEMSRGRGRFLTHGKRQSCAYCQYSILPAYLYRLINQSFLFTFYSIQEKVEKVDSDKIVQSHE